MHLPIILQQVPEELVRPPGGVGHPGTLKATAAKQRHTGAIKLVCQAHGTLKQQQLRTYMARSLKIQ
jgi:hypothetical protein